MIDYCSKRFLAAFMRKHFPKELAKFLFKADYRKLPINIVVNGHRFLKFVTRKMMRIRMFSLVTLHKLAVLKQSMMMTYAQKVSVPHSGKSQYGSHFSSDIFNYEQIHKLVASVKILEDFVAKCHELYFDLKWLLDQLKVFRIYDMFMCEQYEDSTRQRSEFLVWDHTKAMFTMIDIGALLSSVDPSQLVFQIVAKNGFEIYSAILENKIQLQFEFFIPGTKIPVLSTQINRQCGISHVVGMLVKCEGKILSFKSDQMRLVKFGGKHVLCKPFEPFKMGKSWYVYTMDLKKFPRENAAVKAYEEYQLVKAAEEELLRRKHIQCPGCSNWIQKEVENHSSGLVEACNHIACPCGNTLCFRCGKKLADCIANDARNRRELKEAFEEYMSCQNHNRCSQHVLDSKGDIIICHCPEGCHGYRFLQ